MSFVSVAIGLGLAVRTRLACGLNVSSRCRLSCDGRRIGPWREMDQSSFRQDEIQNGEMARSLARSLLRCIVTRTRRAGSRLRGWISTKRTIPCNGPVTPTRRSPSPDFMFGGLSGADESCTPLQRVRGVIGVFRMRLASSLKTSSIPRGTRSADTQTSLTPETPWDTIKPE